MNKINNNMYISPDSSPENNNLTTNPFSYLDTSSTTNPFSYLDTSSTTNPFSYLDTSSTTNPLIRQITNPFTSSTTNPFTSSTTNPLIRQITNPLIRQITNPFTSPTTKKTKKMNNKTNTKNINDMEISPNNDMDISPSNTMKRHIPKYITDAVLKRQNNKCANSIKDYECLLWKINNGNFDDAGYQFDHINEYCLTKDNSLENIQALCPNCHSVKTKRFRKNKNIFTTQELNDGCCIMELD